jgi:two-component system, OmpR family, response regulator
MRILIVEDERRLTQLMHRVLSQERFDVEVAHDGLEGLDRALGGGFDAIVVDRMLPGLDGVDLIHKLREARVSTPALMLTARTELHERVEGLDAGADDYLGKPFAFEELIARLHALARRTDRPLLDAVIEAGPLRIDLAGGTVTCNGDLVPLTRREFALLEALARNRGQILSRDQLLEKVWGYDADPQGNVVELNIHHIRRKIAEACPDAPAVITTVRGAGYLMPKATG